MRLCYLLLSRPRPAKTFTGVISWFGDKLGFYRGITLTLSFGTFPLPPLSYLVPLLSQKTTEDMYQLCISGKGSCQKRGNRQKNEEEYAGRYANIEAQLRILIQTDLEVPLKLITIG